VTVPSTNSGNTTITVPSIPGYTLDPTSPTILPVTYNADGTVTADTASVKYDPIQIAASTTSITSPTGTTLTINIPAGTFGTTTNTADIPTVAGYTSSVSSLPVTYNANGTASIDTSQIQYTPTYINASTTSVKAPNGTNVTITIPGGDFGTTTNTASVPAVPGYTSTVSTLPVTYNDDGTSSVDTSKVQYVPIQIPASTTTIKDPNGNSLSVSLPAGTFGTTTNTALIPTVPGYTTSVASLPVTYNTNGTASIDTSKIIYTPISIPASTTTIKDFNGNPVTVNIPAGTFGTTTNTATIPVIPGYTSSVDSLPVTYTTTGTATVDTSNVKYTPISIPASTTTIKDFNGNPVTVSIPAGTFGTTTNVALIPTIPGYTSNIAQLPVTYTTAGTATVDTSSVQYSPIQIPASTTTIKDFNGNPVTVNIPAGTFGTTTNVALIPTIPGYTSSVAQIPVTYTTAGTSVVDTSNVTYSPIHVAASTTTIKDFNGNNITIDIPAGDFGTTNNVALVPVIPGYDTNISELPVTYTTTGQAIVDTSNIKYTPIQIPASTTTIKDFNGNPVTVNIPAGSFGTTTNVALVPTIPGYTSNVAQLPVTYTTDGRSVVDTSNVTYSPIQIPASTTTIKDFNDNPVTINIPAGSFGTTTNVALIPTIPGYTSSVAQLPVSYTTDGKAVIDTSNVKYTPIQIPASTTTINDFNGNPVTVNIPAGSFGTTTNVALIPAIPGYTSNVSQLPVSYTTDGKAVVDTSNVKYSPIQIPASTTTIKDFNGNPVTISIPAGSFGETDKVADIPQIYGYTSTVNQLPVTYTTDGKATIDTTNVAYIPVHSNVSYINFTSPDKQQTQTVEIPAANFGDVKTIAVPTFKGYTANTETLPVQYDSTGKTFVDTTKVTYTPIHSDASSITFIAPDKNPQDNVVVDIPSIDYGEVQTITVPTFAGYTANKQTLPIQFDNNGKAFVDNSSVVYTGDPVLAGTTNVKTPNGEQTVDVPAGRVGDTVTIIVPDTPGYTHALKTITGKLNAKGQFVPDTTIIYQKIPAQNNYTGKLLPKLIHQTVSTYYDQADIPVYDFNANNTKASLTTRYLAHGTSWFADQKIVVGGVLYLRVATNEWIKADQVYPYVDQAADIRTYSGTDKSLFTAKGQLINSRSVSPNSSWFSNQIIESNDVPYYRVANDEFVRTDDAYIYQPINQVITTRNIGQAQLYTAKGELIQNRALSANTKWLTDSIIYINNVKYYRVATNEFVKATDINDF